MNPTAARFPDGPRSPSGKPDTTARTDGVRTDRASSPTNTQGAASSAKTPAAPCHPAHVNAHEVHTS